MKHWLLANNLFFATCFACAAHVPLTDNPNFDVLKDTGPASISYSPNGYSALRIRLELEGTLNEVERRQWIARALARFADTATASTFVVIVNDQPPIPIFTLLKDANSSQLSPFVGWQRISPPRVFSAVDKLRVRVEVHFSDTMTSSIAAAAQSSISATSAVIGAYPAAIAISKIPPGAISAIDDFIGKTNSSDKKLAPTFEILGSQMGTDFEYKMIFYDSPRGTPNRTKMATLLFGMDHFPSLFFAKFPLVDSGEPISINLVYRGLDGKNEKDSPTSVYGLLRGDTILDRWKFPFYTDYLNLCLTIPSLLGGLGLSPTDLLLQQHSFLNLAQGGSKRVAKDDICPSKGVTDSMVKLGLPNLAATLPVKVNREEVTAALDEMARVVARGVGFENIAMGSVTVRQSVQFFPSEMVGLNEDKTLGGDEIEEFFASFAPPLRVKMSRFDFDGEGSYSGSANLRIEKIIPDAATPTKRFKVRVIMTENLKVRQLYIDPMS